MCVEKLKHRGAAKPRGVPRRMIRERERERAARVWLPWSFDRWSFARPPHTHRHAPASDAPWEEPPGAQHRTELADQTSRRFDGLNEGTDALCFPSNPAVPRPPLPACLWPLLPRLQILLFFFSSLFEFSATVPLATGACTANRRRTPSRSGNSRDVNRPCAKRRIGESLPEILTLIILIWDAPDVSMFLLQFRRNSRPIYGLIGRCVPPWPSRFCI
ncbi:hypothetical protein DENSPDRAFT_242205 [Dentipellis sp. KUC8613]|nr:hypothetical protein DENSPDRAFT_242205 [Dentipellis sp. KUC8613]